MEDAGHLHNLRDIMDRIQALASTVSLLQLASGRRKTGGHRKLDKP